MAARADSAGGARRDRFTPGGLISAGVLSASQLSGPPATPPGLAAGIRRGAQSLARSGLDSKFVRISDRLFASEGMVEQLTSQVIDLRSQVLVSAGKLKKDEGALLLGQIDAVLRKQSELQELTHQLSHENAILRSQVREAVGNGSALLESPSPSRRAMPPRGVSPVAAPAGHSHADIMDEFVRSVEECKGLSRQLSEKNKKLEKLSLVLASMERALVTSERQRLIAEQKIQDLSGESQQDASLRESRAGAGEAERGAAESAGDSDVEDKKDSLQLSAGGKSAGGGGILKNDVKRMAEALSKREMERDEARSQLHTALSLLERASQLTGAINSVSSSAAVAESSELTTSHSDTDGEPAVVASTFGQAPSVHADNNLGLGNTVEVEVEALRMGSVVANQWRAESLELSDKLRRVQQALDLSLSENASLRSAANKRETESLAVEQARAELLRQKSESSFKERALIDAQKQMDKKIEDLESEVVALRRRRTVDADEISELETRALVAEQSLISIQNNFQMAQEELELAKDEKDSLLRHHMHLKQMAKVYAPSSILVRESDHYALDSVLVKKKTHAFSESAATLRHAYAHSEPTTPGRPHDARAHSATGENNGSFASGDGDLTPSRRAGSARGDRMRAEAEGNKPQWKVVGPYSSPKTRK